MKIREDRANPLEMVARIDEEVCRSGTGVVKGAHGLGGFDRTGARRSHANGSLRIFNFGCISGLDFEALLMQLHFLDDVRGKRLECSQADVKRDLRDISSAILATLEDLRGEV